MATRSLSPDASTNERRRAKRRHTTPDLDSSVERKTKTNRANGAAHATKMERDSDGWFCFFCGLRFGKKSALRLHLPSHVVGCPKRVKCGLCKQTFPDDARKEAHFAAEHFQCSICKSLFRSHEAYFAHRLKVHGEIIRRHPLSFDGSSQVFTFYFQQITHSDKGSAYQCPRCPQMCTTQQNLFSHLRGHRRRDWAELAPPGIKNSSEVTPDRLPYICDACDDTYNTSGDFNEHMRSKHHIQIRLRNHNNMLKALESELHYNAQRGQLQEYIELLQRDGEAEGSKPDNLWEELVASNPAPPPAPEPEVTNVTSDPVDEDQEIYIDCRIKGCSFISFSQNILYRHLSKHHMLSLGPIDFQEQFVDPSKSSESYTLHKCPQCLYVTISDLELDEHVKGHKKGKDVQPKLTEASLRLACQHPFKPECNYFAYDQKTLDGHYRSAHECLPDETEDFLARLRERAEEVEREKKRRTEAQAAAEAAAALEREAAEMEALERRAASQLCCIYPSCKFVAYEEADVEQHVIEVHDKPAAQKAKRRTREITSDDEDVDTRMEDLRRMIIEREEDADDGEHDLLDLSEAQAKFHLKARDVCLRQKSSFEESLRIQCRFEPCNHYEYNVENMERHYDWKHKKDMAKEKWRLMKEAGELPSYEPVKGVPDASEALKQTIEEIVTTKGVHRCPVNKCSFESSSKEDLVKHREIHDDSDVLLLEDDDVDYDECDDDDDEFGDDGRGPKRNIYARVNTEPNLVCPVPTCPFTTKTLDQLDEHRHQEHARLTESYLRLNCPYDNCRFYCYDKPSLEQHMLAHHLGEELPPSSPPLQRRDSQPLSPPGGSGGMEKRKKLMTEEERLAYNRKRRERYWVIKAKNENERAKREKEREELDEELEEERREEKRLEDNRKRRERYRRQKEREAALKKKMEEGGKEMEERSSEEDEEEEEEAVEEREEYVGGGDEGNSNSNSGLGAMLQRL